MESNSAILDKVIYLLSIAKKGSYDSDELEEIERLIGNHSNHMILGRVFGYSVSDYALATLKWLGSEETLKKYQAYERLMTDAQKKEVDELVKKNIYLQLEI